jgi:hypothetical protein
MDEAGYRCEVSTQVPLNELLPGNSVVNITNVAIEHNQLVIVINLRIPTSQATDSLEQRSEQQE